MATKPKTYTAKNKVPGYDYPDLAYKARTPQGAGRAAKAASDQARVRNRMEKSLEAKLGQLRHSGGRSLEKEIGTTRGSRVKTLRERQEANEAYKTKARRNPANRPNAKKGK